MTPVAHPSRTEVEAYVQGEVPEARLDALEAHFDACGACSDRLREAVEGEIGVRAAAASVPDGDPKGRVAPARSWRRSSLAAASGLLVAAMAFWFVSPPPPAALPAYRLELGAGVQAMRGPAEVGVVPRFEAGGPFELVLRPETTVATAVQALVYLDGATVPAPVPTEIAAGGAVRVRGTSDLGPGRHTVLVAVGPADGTLGPADVRTAWAGSLAWGAWQFRTGAFDVVPSR